MKKLIIILLLIVPSLCLADVSTDLTTSWEEKAQREVVFSARATLENATNVLQETNTRIQEIIDSGQFDTIPDDLKGALNRWRNILKSADTAIEADTEIMDVYGWRP